jgi:4-diphosphocytidyl-2-C-methyl-D-erythritol kinase
LPQTSSSTPREFTVEAPAKVNLHLSILGKRSDGFHEIDTLMQTVSLHDSLRIVSTDDAGVSLRMEGRVGGVVADESNLVLRAAALLREKVGERGASILLVKRVPTGAGLGGGSSDAAAALVGLCRAWNVALAEGEMLDMCASLGSDVPFFLRGGTARCTGRGERVERIASEGAMHMALVFSPPLSTAAVYGRLNNSGIGPSHAGDAYGSILTTENGGLDLSTIRLRPVWNELEAAALEVAPSLARVKHTLIAEGADQVAMSGSGSCFYGVVESHGLAKNLAARLQERGLDAVAVESVGPRAP